MNKSCFTFLFAALLCAGYSYSQQIAFPGAEGWGRFATGGRLIDPTVGNKVYYVTRLDDCSDDNLVEGTLRWALRDGDDTPRTILFKVAGTIKLSSKLKFAHPNVTIAGQSAPGGGVCISGANIYVSKGNVIIRYVRFRAGDEADSNYSALDVENVENVIIDHCSFSWSMEENVTMYDNRNTTMQWCILSEPLYYSRHKKGERGYGSQWGGENSTYHHNLLAHCVSRAPRINGARDKSTTVGAHDQFVDTEIINNVIYNWGNKGAVYGGELESVIEGAYSRTNLINNYYKPGPTTNAFQDRWFADLSHTASKATGAGQWYIDGNMFEINQYKNDKNKGDHSAVNADNWANVLKDSKRAVNIRLGNTQAMMDSVRLYEPSASSGLTMTTAAQAYEDVIAKAGARLPRLDEVDERILAEAGGKQEPQFHGAFKPAYLGVIDSQNNLKPEGAGEEWNAWPDLSMLPGETILLDSDGDGMPDEWEDANGFDKNNAADGAEIAVNGYSNLENYLNNIVDNPLNIAIGNRVKDLDFTYDYNSHTLSYYAGQIVESMRIVDMTGSSIAMFQMNKEKDDIILPILQKGVYCLLWKVADGTISCKKIIIR